ncbi:sporulation integral membrane protein YtvI [Ammoniphilus oxalaticus]|uniref:Sporulation integral membrane protein YtvI n=1 Tax=Ammoniphilus oxalaticus TaxID=66863 RepID=A0A419SGM2_9BACL|nr:sporulation integral membrane protein YtvI [Ammoniphilus oxalaticus]RKD22933.1 sporulation integral membrane protein YtvI [Ammoniphilus oxalaticus]
MSRRQIANVLVFIILFSILIWKSGPLLLAFLTAVLIEPLIRLLIKTTGLKRIWASSITFLLFLMTFLLGCYWVGTTLFVQSVQLAERLPYLSEHMMGSIAGIVEQFEKYYDLLPDETVFTIRQALVSLQNSAIAFASSIGKWVLGIIAGIPELLITTIIYLVGLFLISLDLPGIQARFMNLFTDSAREKVELVIKELNRAAIGFLGAQLMLSTLTYMLTFIGLFILNIHYAAAISLVVILVDILPILGTGSVFVPWAIVLFINEQNKIAIGLLILFIVITVTRRIIEPKILGTSLGISALAAFASMFIGFKLIGLFGLALGPALVIIVQALLNADFIKIKIDF